jgi:hypothetical protein
MINRRELTCVIGSVLASLPIPAWSMEAEAIHFDMLYKSFGVRGIEFSDRLKTLNAKSVVMAGYMAPPLKPESNFFVLTREPLSICPFCQSDADWPLDIVVIYLKKASPLISAGAQIHVTGTLDIGSWIDPETGFVSLLRIIDASYSKSR